MNNETPSKKARELVEAHARALLLGNNDGWYVQATKAERALLEYITNLEGVAETARKVYFDLLKAVLKS